MSFTTNSAREAVLCLGCRLSLWLQAESRHTVARNARASAERSGARFQDVDHVYEQSALKRMAALTNALQALGARAKQTVMRQPNAIKALHDAVRDAVGHDSRSLKQPGLK